MRDELSNDQEVPAQMQNARSKRSSGRARAVRALHDRLRALHSDGQPLG